MKYGKLVRDKVPDIIKEKGQKARIHTASEDEYYLELLKKLNEEVTEFEKSDDAEELADILEVVYALALAKGVQPEELQNVREKKAEEKGRFHRRIVLDEVEE